MAKRKDSEQQPLISDVTPIAAIPGGEFQIRGKGLARSQRTSVTIGDVHAPVIIGSDSFVIARVPEGASIGELIVGSGGDVSRSWICDIGIQIADGMHPVASPAVDAFGNIYCTFSGSRGQKTPVAVFKVDLNYNVVPFITDLMNATSLAIDRDGMLYISSR
ncbi:MAG: IPT/TIG domain-containing protein, partial [Bryobacteraceae bacterium]